MQRPYALKLEEGGREALPLDCVERIEERLKWAEKVCKNAWEPTNSSTSTTANTSDSDVTVKLLSTALISPSSNIHCIMSNISYRTAFSSILFYALGYSVRCYNMSRP